MLQVVPAEQRARAVAAGERVAAHHVGQVGIGVGAAADRADIGQARAPDVVAQHRAAGCQAQVAAQARLRRLAAAPSRPSSVTGSTPYGWRRSAARQRAGACTCADEVLARPVDALGRQAGAAGSRSVGQVVAPGRRPQRGGHLPCVGAWSRVAGVRQAADRQCSGVAVRPSAAASQRALLSASSRRRGGVLRLAAQSCASRRGSALSRPDGTSAVLLVGVPGGRKSRPSV